MCRYVEVESMKIEDTAVKGARWSRNRVAPRHPASHWALFTPILFRREADTEVQWRPECPVACLSHGPACFRRIGVERSNLKS